jgi:N-alpha-acetyltransferase 40
MRQAVWDLFESNMHDLYKPSCHQTMQKFLHACYSYLNSPAFGGWNPKAKKKELFNLKSRFILVHPTDLTTRSLLAFSMFRFEYEEDELALYW